MGLFGRKSSKRKIEEELIKERKKADKAMSELKIILDNVSAGLIYITTDYVVQWESTDAIKGCFENRAYVPGEVCYRNVFHRDTPCEICAIREMFASGKKEVHLYGEGNVTVELSANPVYEKGALVGGLLKIENVSERVKQENHIRDLNRTMAAILNNIPVYLFVKDPSDDFRYLYWNKAMAAYTKIPTSKVIGNNDFEIFPSKIDAERFRRDDLALLKRGKTLTLQEDYLTSTGEMRTVKTIKTLIPSESGGQLPWIIGFSWDITDLKKTERDLIIARDKAEQSNKMKSSFLANMSHEIRTPLNAIVGFSELMTGTADEAEKAEYIDIIRKNNELLLQLISDILDLSKIEAQSLEFVYSNVDVNAMCESIVKMGNLKEEARVPVIFGKHTEKCCIYSDEKRVSQVILNMVNNALKFTSSGSVTVGYKIVDNCDIEFYVQDTGRGIPADKVGSIFDRFVKLDAFAQGTGLGLSICKSIVEQLNGSIGVESKEGAGSRFWFRLPYNDELSTDNPKETCTPSQDKEKKTILIAESCDPDYILLENMLCRDYNLKRAKDGKETMEVFIKESPDLVIMDLKISDINGLKASHLIRERSRTVPIIAVSASADSEDLNKIKNAGYNELVSKHISSSAFRKKIEGYLL